MVRHPTPAQQLGPTRGEMEQQELLVAAPVFVGQEDLLAIVAAMGDVMRHTRRHHPRLAGHGTVSRLLLQTGPIVKGSVPLAHLSAEAAIVVLHSLTTAGRARRGNVQLDLPELLHLCSLPLLGSEAAETRPNFDGMLGVPYSDPPRSYVQVFRDGSIEIADAQLLSSRRVGPTLGMGGNQELSQNNKWVPYPKFELYVAKALKRMLGLQASMGVEPPVSVTLNLLRVKDYQISMEQDFDFNDEVRLKVDRDSLLCPEILVEDLSRDAATALKPTFDAVWNAAGYPRSLSYDERGEWRW